MDWIWASLLGVIQGLTEFLPVSSSGHLALATRLGNFKMADELFFDLCLHVGSLIAVVIYFRAEIKELWAAAVALTKQLATPRGFPRLIQEKPFCTLFLFLLAATVVTGIIGLFLHDRVLEAFSSPKAIAVGWFGTAFLLTLAQIKLKKSFVATPFRWYHALVIGLFQSIALFPGISRSGATLTAALLCGLSQEKAFRFSFLLSIPAIVMAFLGEAFFQRELLLNGLSHIPLYFLGLFVSALFSYFALNILSWFLVKRQLIPFIIYTALLGVIVFF